MKTICIDLVQKSELENKQWFIKLVEKLSQDDFRLFCKEIMHLNEYYASTAGLFVTDMAELEMLNPERVWQLEKIDFNDDVNFKQIS